MKVTKKTMLLAGTPLFEDPAIGLKINTIRPVGGTQFVLGGEARMRGANLRRISEGVAGFLLTEGTVTIGSETQIFTCDISYASDGKSATMHLTEGAVHIPAGEYEATLDFVTGDAEGSYSKSCHLPITLVVPKPKVRITSFTHNTIGSVTITGENFDAADGFSHFEGEFDQLVLTLENGGQSETVTFLRGATETNFGANIEMRPPAGSKSVVKGSVNPARTDVEQGEFTAECTVEAV